MAAIQLAHPPTVDSAVAISGVNAQKFIPHPSARKVSVFFDTDDGLLAFDAAGVADATPLPAGHQGPVSADAWFEVSNKGAPFYVQSSNVAGGTIRVLQEL